MDALRAAQRCRRPHRCPGGERRRIACWLLLCRPLHLDEPTNHLDAESVDWLERFLQEYPARWRSPTTGTSSTTWPSGSSSRPRPGLPVRGQLLVVARPEAGGLAHEEKQASARQRTLQRELEWVRMRQGPPGQGRARLSAYEKLRPKPRPAPARDRLEIAIPPGPRLGDQVIEVEHLRRLRRAPLLHAAAGGLWAPLGRTAAGMPRCSGCYGRDTPDGGTVTVGDTVELAYVDQAADTSTPTRPSTNTYGASTAQGGNREITGYVAGFDLSRAPTTGSRRATCPAASATAGQARRAPAATLRRSTSPPTISTSTPSAPSRTVSRIPGLRRRDQPRSLVLDRIRPTPRLRGRHAGVWFEGNFSASTSKPHKELGTDADTPHRASSTTR